MTRLRLACREFVTVLRTGETGFGAGHDAAYRAFINNQAEFINNRLEAYGLTELPDAPVLTLAGGAR